MPTHTNETAKTISVYRTESNR